MTIAESALTQAAHPDENPSTEADDSVLDGERVDSLPRSPGRHRPPTSRNSTSLTGKLVALLAAAALIGIGTAAAAATHSSGCDNCAAGIRLQGTFFGAFEQDAANGSGPQLYRITTALLESDLDIVSAKIETLGSQVIDAFYVRDRKGAKIDDDQYLVEIQRGILYALTVDL